MTEPPEIGLVSGETGTVDPRLLTCSNPNNLPILGVTHRVGLCVLEGNCGHDQVTDGGFWKLKGQRITELIFKFVICKPKQLKIHLTSFLLVTTFAKTELVIAASFLFCSKLSPKSVLTSMSLGT
jgi:hypothetical protein